MTKKTWMVLFAVAGIIDAVEFLTDLLLTEFFAIPEAVWEIADRIFGILLIAFLEYKNVDVIKNFKRLASMIGVQGAEALTGGAAPAWIVDVWYIYKDVMREEAEAEAERQQQALLEKMQGEFHNEDGMRMPNKRMQPIHDGSDVRAPNSIRK
ncbi:MAG: hypothetical protein JWO73_877 [Candidatus Taylorbacteria bacterium]|nr:hypothetical protein [Candidatus Taylorbacteria bacterium]